MLALAVRLDQVAFREYKVFRENLDLQAPWAHLDCKGRQGAMAATARKGLQAHWLDGPAF
jgi:hypothetical protein